MNMRTVIPFPRIRDLREDRDWKQATIASMLNITQTCYSKYEIGTCDIPTAILIKLADIYDTSIDYLLNQTDNPYRYK